MIIGVPKEIKDNENRVALTPENVSTLVNFNHKVLVQQNAGDGSGFADDQYKEKGAEIIDSSKKIFDESEMIVKVKEPINTEYDLMHENQIIFTFFHFASSIELINAVIEKKVVAIAYETVQNNDGSLPILAPMSEIAGKLSTQIGAYLLTKPFGGNGVLIGGALGTFPANVVVLGAGTAGVSAAIVASGMGAKVFLMDINIERLRALNFVLARDILLIKSNPSMVSSLCSEADIVIGAVLIPGKKAPKVVTEKNVGEMKKGSVIIDISIDQGGCIETSHPTTHSNPIFLKDDIIHYCVTNMPGIVPRTSTIALSNTTISYIVELANKGYQKAILENISLRRGLSIDKGELIDESIKECV